MKKTLFSAIPVAIALASVFIACNKENDVLPTGSEEQNQQMSDADVEKKILNFKEQLTLKSGGEAMLVEEVVWNVEAALNYTYCVVFEGEEIVTNTTMLDSAFISVNPTEGTLTMAQIQEAYTTIETFATTTLAAIKSNAKRIAVVDVEYAAQIHASEISNTPFPASNSAS